jgi:hypothetical protein
VGEGREVDDRGAALGSAPDRARIEDILAVGNVEADDFVTQTGQVPGYYRADTASLACDENAHTDHDPRQPSSPHDDIFTAPRLVPVVSTFLA